VIFIIRLTPMPGIDPIRALRRALKAMRRYHGLRCVSAVQEADFHHPAPARREVVSTAIPAVAGIDRRMNSGNS
jgi:hypothetical protein